MRWFAHAFYGIAAYTSMSGSGLMFYSRSADDMFYPRTSAVRATQYMAAHQFIQVGGGTMRPGVVSAFVSCYSDLRYHNGKRIESREK